MGGIRRANRRLARVANPVFVGEIIASHSEISAKRNHSNRSGKDLIDGQVALTNRKGELISSFNYVY